MDIAKCIILIRLKQKGKSKMLYIKKKELSIYPETAIGRIQERIPKLLKIVASMQSKFVKALQKKVKINPT